jgi:hypothetical protein
MPRFDNPPQDRARGERRALCIGRHCDEARLDNERPRIVPPPLARAPPASSTTLLALQASRAAA